MSITEASLSTQPRQRVLLIVLLAVGIIVAAGGVLSYRLSGPAGSDAIAGAVDLDGGLPPEMAASMAGDVEQYGQNVSPVVEYAVGPRDAVARAVSGAGIPDSQLVYVVVARGEFVYGNFSGPLGSSAPTGKVLVVAYAADSGTVLDFGVTNAPPDLSVIGPVRYAVLPIDTAGG